MSFEAGNVAMHFAETAALPDVLSAGAVRRDALGAKSAGSGGATSMGKSSARISRTMSELSHEPIFVKSAKTANGDRVAYGSEEMAKLPKSWKQGCVWGAAADRSADEGRGSPVPPAR